MASNDPYTRDHIAIKNTKTGRTTEVPPRSLDAFRERGWVPIEEDPPGSKALVGEWREYATTQDPENAEAIAAMTKTELQQQYGDSE